jgi:signal transduction histidine kinase
VSEALADAEESRKPYAAEFRIVRTDGAIRWITARGKYYYDSHGNALRLLGISVDITDRKAAEEALSSLSGRLIEAQEEERSRIAREIHDDYTQRLAVLAIDLEEMAGNIGQANGSAAPRLHQLWNYVSELAADLHALSHSLHSSTLETLGLVAGISAFCEEFAHQHDMQIDFVHENVPPGIPQEAALCIFRSVQESLRNVKRHSGTDRAEVRLDAINETLHLSVSDHGRGFDPTVRSSKSGIGLRSIEERLRLMGGRFEIHSRLMEGTRVEAWLPIKVASMAVN